jgi:hypothetical protein
VRLVAIVLSLAAGGLAVRRQRALVEVLREFFLTPSVPENVALVRIVAFASILFKAVHSPAVWYASLPDAFRTVRYGWEWLQDALPFLYGSLGLLRSVLIVAAVLSVVGLFTRVAMIVASTLAVFVLAVPTFYFKVNHDMHVQTLVALVVAFAPAGDALSLDAVLRKRRGFPRFGRSVAYTLPVRFAWLLVGTMYFFPGLWKLWDAGDLWLDGSALKNILVGQYAELPDFYPMIRADRSRLLLVVMGTATLVVEIGYVFAVFRRTTRVIMAVSAAAFHIGVGFTLDIWFDFVFPMIALFDFPEILDRRYTRPMVARIPPLQRWVDDRTRLDGLPSLASTRDTGAAPFLVGSLLVLGMTVAGLTLINSFPIGVYPRFAGRAPRFSEPVAEKSTFVEVFVKQADGSEQRLTEDDFHPLNRDYRFVVAQLVDAKSRRDARKRRRCEALLSRVIRENRPALVRAGATIVLYRSEYLLDPDLRKGARPTREEVLEADF